MLLDDLKLDHYAYTEKDYDGTISLKYANLPLTSSINIEHFEQTQEISRIDELEENRKIRIYALENALNYESFSSKHYLFKNEEWDKSKQELTLVSIPSIFFGSSIKKGSVSLKINYTGTLVSVLEDTRKNGELLQTYPINDSNFNKCAGVVLYNHGFIILTGSWNLDNNLSWKTFGSSSSEETLVSSSYDVDFSGINYVPNITMMAHAPKLQFNFSNNPTFIAYEDKNKDTFINGAFYENDSKNIKNIVKYPYENFTGSLEKQTYISKIGIFDEQKNLIAIAKLAKPIKKTEVRDFTFKLKLDF